MTATNIATELFIRASLADPDDYHYPPRVQFVPESDDAPHLVLESLREDVPVVLVTHAGNELLFIRAPRPWPLRHIDRLLGRYPVEVFLREPGDTAPVHVTTTASHDALRDLRRPPTFA